MAQVCVEIEGSVDEVIGVLVQLGSAGRRATARDAGRSVETPAGGGKQATPVTGARTAAGSREAAPGNGRRPSPMTSWPGWNRRPGG